MQTLCADRIGLLADDIKEVFEDSILSILCRLNAIGELESFLDMAGWLYLVEDERDQAISYKDGKILVVGGSNVKQNILEGIAKSMGISKNRLEFVLNYDEAQRYNYDKLKNQSKYAAVIFGPVPHKTVGVEDYSSIIARVKTEYGFPPVETLGDNELHISKENFKRALADLLKRNIISAG